MHPFRHWRRHMAVAPKGFLRYQVLKLLNEKPMSGSEIMSEIEKLTDGHWRPSPGSIYPLLAWLQDKGYIEEAAQQEVGSKRYVLTKQGKTFLEEHVKTREELRRRFEHFVPEPGFFGPMWPMRGPMWFKLGPEKAKELRRATRDLAMAVRDLHERLSREESEKMVEEAKKVLEEATKKIEAVTKKTQ